MLNPIGLLRSMHYSSSRGAKPGDKRKRGRVSGAHVAITKAPRTTSLFSTSSWHQAISLHASVCHVA